ncbi:MAG: glycosyltransferase [Clostridiales bacterium]|nr:glycosyltransferase [Clostridiales bacterium]
MKIARTKQLAYVTILVTIGYIFWRIFFTLPVKFGTVSMIFGILLLAAEIMGLFEQIVHFYMMSEVEKPTCLHTSKNKYPTVDVFIATYNEPEELLYKTVNGCLHMDYPDKSKVQIYLCDDGSRQEIKKLADKLGVNYLARENHEGAKAGNLNHALANSSGDLIVTFDADMIPMRDFLMACVPYFMQGIKVGFVQTPQSFYNLDLFQYNLFAESAIPNEQDYFYHDIQLSKNKTNSVIYGGSNTMLNREALNEIGGFVTSVITEDFATGMLIQSKGYQCYAIDEVHASGLAPQDLNNLIKQRRRWARGCIQSGRKLKIMTIKGLTFKQRLSYISSISYWYDSIKRLIYMLSPILFIFFGITALDASPIELLCIWLPTHMINRYTIKLLSGSRRTVHWTNIYETIMFPLLLKDVLLEMVGISDHVFAVTNKDGAKEDKRLQRRLAIPHVILATLSFVGILKSVRFMFQTGSVAILFLIFWLVVNLYNLSIAIFFMIGRRSYRKFERFKITADAKLSFHGTTISAVTYDISEGGCSVILPKPAYVPADEAIQIKLQTELYETSFTANVVQVMECKEGFRYAFTLKKIEEKEYNQLLQILHDRVPPLTKFVDSELGVLDKLHNNIEKRREKHMDFQRKLPRLYLNYEAVSDQNQKVRLTSFNYCYVTLRTEADAVNELTVRIDQIILKLSFVKGQDGEYLYEIKNQEELKSNDFLINLFMANHTEMKQKRKDGSRNKKKKESEFNEMEYV